MGNLVLLLVGISLTCSILFGSGFIVLKKYVCSFQSDLYTYYVYTMKALSHATIAILVLLFVLPSFTLAQDLPSPEDYFGFQMGADRKLARWDKLVEYYTTLGEASPRMNVVEAGPSTLGNPFLVLYISSPENLANLDALKEMNAILADPREASEEAVQQAISNGKVVMVQSFGLHSTEVAPSQTAAEFTWDMLTREDEEMMRILENTISIIIPCFNPDGNLIVTDWYNETVGTEYEGLRPPELYHHYIGHDNNRDAFMQNTIESVYGAEIMFREWVPQAYIDHHQMGAYTARLYVPPYAEPIRPHGDPLVWREMSWYGAHIAYKEEEAGKAGVVNAAIYSGWGHFGFHWITPFHNIAGMLTESASALLATPLYVHPEQLQGSRQLPEYEAQTTFPNPWKGGWWRVRDIVEQQKISAMAALDIAARSRETVLRNMYLKSIRQTERGANGETKAYIIPTVQHDKLTADKMVNVLLGQGIHVERATEAFTHEGRIYEAGTHIVSMAQPKMGVIRWLLGRTFYPDNSYTRDRENNPIRPYDMSTDNIAEYMGVRVDPVSTPVSVVSTRVTEKLAPEGTVQAGNAGYLLKGQFNDTFKAVNLLWDEGIAIRRVSQGIDVLSPGDFIVPASVSAETATQIATSTGVHFEPLNLDATSNTVEIDRPRIAMYQRYLGGNMDEGWTRLLLERFGFPYTTVHDDDMTVDNLQNNFDVLILPDDNVDRMTGDHPDTRGYDGPGPKAYPPEFQSGFGQAGVDAIDSFVKAGGTLVTFATASALPIQKFDLPVRNVVEGVPSKEFWSPGSTLRMIVDTNHPIGYGMPEKALGLFLRGNHAYEVIPSLNNHKITRVVSFIDRDIMQSGWLLGEQHIANKAAVLSVEHGEGRIELIGFRAQHRVQTHGTFKLVFNALVRD